MELKFTKMEGAGNDFIFVMTPSDEETFRPDSTDPLSVLARRLCDRHYGVGGDGLILLRPAGGEAGSFPMRILNADGSDARMCGNAVRCAAVYLREKGYVSGGRSG